MREIQPLSPATNEILSHREPALKLIDSLSRMNQTISVVDGCGGHLVNQLTVPGATRAFRMGVVANNRETKLALGVPSQILDRFGEYSLETAQYLARLALSFHHDQVGLAVVGDWVAMAKASGSSWSTHLLFPQQPQENQHSHQFTQSQAALSLTKMFIVDRHHLAKNSTRLPMITRPPLFDTHLLTKVQHLSRLLQQSQRTIATMESCTGGALASALESTSSHILKSAWVTYDEDAKASLGVPLELMAYGTVYSERVALAMAEAIQKRTGAEISMATTGTMDTADTRPYHTDTQPGTVYTAICVQGLPPLVKKLRLPVAAREQMKAVIVTEMLDDLGLLLQAPQLANLRETIIYPHPPLMRSSND